MLRNRPSAAGVSSFQGLAMLPSGRVGIGNIARVATAIGSGGPGAVVWMAGHDRLVADVRPLLRPVPQQRGLPPALANAPRSTGEV
jgi:hypothetical protein